MAEISENFRFFWRFFAVFLLPLVFLALGAWRYLRDGIPTLPKGQWGRQLGFGFLALAIGALLWRGSGP